MGFRFSASKVDVTPMARIVIGAAGHTTEQFLSRHYRGDWGVASELDKKANERALEEGFAVMSVFQTDLLQIIWVMTDGARYVTTIICPEEYYEGHYKAA